MKKITKTLGPVSANLISSLYDLDKTIFETSDVKKITGLSQKAASSLTSSLVKKKIITRLKMGKYIIIPQELGSSQTYIGNWYVVGREIVNSLEYYISHYSAMEIHNMVTHPLLKVFITTPKQKYHKEKIVGNTTFEFIFSKKDFIWGVNNYWVTNSEKVRVSDIERTIIDCLYQPKFCGGILEIAAGIWMKKDSIDFDKLLKYAFKYKKNIVFKRLGYILECFKLKDDNYLSKLRIKINNKYYLLDPVLDKKKTHKNSWKLIANIGAQEIQEVAST